MVERPAVFSAPMVRVLLDGRKTQTRRLAWRVPSIALVWGASHPDHFPAAVAARGANHVQAVGLAG